MMRGTYAAIKIHEQRRLDQKKAIGNLEKLRTAARLFLEIDGEIHSRSEDTPWEEIERMAKVYTTRRENLKLLLQVS